MLYTAYKWDQSFFPPLTEAIKRIIRGQKMWLCFAVQPTQSRTLSQGRDWQPWLQVFCPLADLGISQQGSWVVRVCANLETESTEWQRCQKWQKADQPHIHSQTNLQVQIAMRLQTLRSLSVLYNNAELWGKKNKRSFRLASLKLVIIIIAERNVMVALNKLKTNCAWCKYTKPFQVTQAQEIRDEALEAWRDEGMEGLRFPC